MKNPNEDFKKFRKFLETIPLDKYRHEFKNIKFVEQDLHPLLFPLESIYENYWEKRNYLTFEDWFNEFLNKINQDHEKSAKINDLKELVRSYRKFYENQINNHLEEKVLLGFKARMNCQWISMLTQLDFCYLFEFVCAVKKINLKIECNAELDSNGIDVQIGDIGFQIAKISQRSVAQKILRKSKVIKVNYILGWQVDQFKEKINNPRTRKKEFYQKVIIAFDKYLLKLPNGFTVSHENYINSIINNIDDIEKLRKTIEQISLELAGEY